MIVYCQGEAACTQRVDDKWRGIHRITLPVKRSGAAATVEFDWACVRDVVRTRPGIALTLGYNTAVFCVWMRLLGVRNLINMDGLEWRREKWRSHERAWLWVNERIGCWTGEHLIADHPVIADHLATRVRRSKITTIAYGADHIRHASTEPLSVLGLVARRYGIVIGRPEPENSILEVVRAFSQKKRDAKLVVLGKFESEKRSYHREVLDSASDEVLFPGAIYDVEALRALRFHARFYLHGHKVGGTNPSLVEALGAENAIVAHDNPFNRWVAGPGARFFSSEQECERHIDALLNDDEAVERMRAASHVRFADAFGWVGILDQYEALLSRYCRVGTDKASTLQERF